jgi:hypothetical protein
MHKHTSLLTIGLGILGGLGVLLAVHIQPQELFGSVQDGLDFIESSVGIPTNTDPRTAVERAILYLVTFLALAAFVVIVIAGFILVVGLGSEASITRTKKIFIYTFLGLLVVFFASVIVSFFTVELPGGAS